MPIVVLGGESTLGAFYLTIVKGPTLDVVGVSWSIFAFLITSPFVANLLLVGETVVVYPTFVFGSGMCKYRKSSFINTIVFSIAWNAMGVGLPTIGWIVPSSSSSYLVFTNHPII